MFSATLRGRLTLLALMAAGIAPAAQAQKLTGAGATFPNPIYSKWFDAYNKKTGIQINYQSIGSGGGIRQFTEGTVDFGATDGPMNESQLTAVNGNVVHIPTVLGAVVVTYNLPSIGSTQLRLDGTTLVDIFMGRITKWNDKRIASLNPGVTLPNIDLIVVHRSDGSGTTYVFTDFLNKYSREWKDKVGYATSVNWPVGLGGKGNEGVTQQVKQVEGAVGYVELIYAVSNNLPYMLLKNAAGNFVAPSLESASAAAASATVAGNSPPAAASAGGGAGGPNEGPVATEYVPYGESPLAGSRLERLRAMASMLEAQQFKGRIRVESYVGDFCYDFDICGYPERLCVAN